MNAAFEQRHIDRKDIIAAAALCGIDDETAALAADAFERERAFCEKYAPRCARKFCPRLLRKPPIVRLACVLAATTYSHERYRELGIGDDVFAATMSDIGIWARNCRVRDGVVGLANYPWVSHHLTLRLFRIGRLQFQFFKLYCPLGAISRLRKMSPPHALGENILNVHVPQGEKLDPAACEASFDAARGFFARHFPDYRAKCFFIDSWLLGPVNKTLLPSSSNINVFADMFSLIAVKKCKGWDDAERIFDCKRRRVQMLPQDTSLRRAAAKLLADGGCLERGFGIRHL